MSRACYVDDMGYLSTAWVVIASLVVAPSIVGCGGSSDVKNDGDAGEGSDAAGADVTTRDDGGGIGGDSATDASSTGDASVCQSDQVACSGACVDTKTDPRHCGGCTKSCGAGETCVASTCSCAGTVCNGSKCTDVKSDPLNCGQCGRIVCHGETCVAGQPTCAPGLKACGAAGCLGCKETNVDPENCGACGVRCAAGQACNARTCVVGCGANLTPCTSGAITACVDRKSDLFNCGACGTVCAPGELCVDGACAGYSSGVGCTTCPCATCATLQDRCCMYASAPVCTSAAQCP